MPVMVYSAVRVGASAVVIRDFDDVCGATAASRLL